MKNLLWYFIISSFMLFLTGFVETAFTIEEQQDALEYLENRQLSLGEVDDSAAYRSYPVSEEYSIASSSPVAVCRQIVDVSSLAGHVEPPVEVAGDVDELSDTVEEAARFIARLEAGEQNEQFEYQYDKKSGQIGYGFTRHVYPGLNWKSRITVEEADAYLRKLIRERYIPFIVNTVKVPLSKEQMVSLVSLCFNIGEPQFAESDVVQMLNNGDYFGASYAFKKIVKSNGKRLEGLVKRRTAEKTLFMSGI